MNLFYSILNHFPFTDQRSDSTNITDQQRVGPPKNTLTLLYIKILIQESWKNKMNKYQRLG